MSILKLYSALAIIFFAVGCTQSPKSEEPVEFDLYQELVIPGSQGIFRGMNVSDEPHIILNKESEVAIISSDSLIQYQFNYIDDADTLEVDVYYAFDTFGLFEIQSDIYTSSSSENKAWLNQLKTGLTAQFGDAESIGNMHRWTTSSPSNNIVEISLGEERDLDGTPFISLNILEPLDNEL